MLKKLASSGRDLIRVMDKGLVHLRTRAGEIVSGQEWGLEDLKPVVEVKGWVKLLMREAGKIVPGSHREGHTSALESWVEQAKKYEGGER